MNGFEKTFVSYGPGNDRLHFLGDINNNQYKHSFESSGMNRKKLNGPQVLVSPEKAPPVL